MGFGEPYWIRTNDTFLKREVSTQQISPVILDNIRSKESCTAFIQNIWQLNSNSTNNYAESYFLKVNC